jgi:hypothetical protein
VADYSASPDFGLIQQYPPEAALPDHRDVGRLRAKPDKCQRGNRQFKENNPFNRKKISILRLEADLQLTGGPRDREYSPRAWGELHRFPPRKSIHQILDVNGVQFAFNFLSVAAMFCDQLKRTVFAQVVFGHEILDLVVLTGRDFRAIPIIPF